jgi:hypothetical protein
MRARDNVLLVTFVLIIIVIRDCNKVIVGNKVIVIRDFFDVSEEGIASFFRFSEIYAIGSSESP